jgi:glucose 1-dehydrogenase
VRLEGKTAIVTGGARGIGRAIARELARNGAKIVIAYRENEEAARSSIADIKAESGEAIAIRTDVGNKKDIENLLTRTLEEFGRIDILINAAGIAFFGSFFDISESELDALLSTNVKGVFLLSQAVAREMARAKSGKIVNVSSISGEKADPELVAYCGTKGAVNMLTKAMAVALGKYNIQVNAILPGTIVTDMNRKRLANLEIRNSIEILTPLGRLGTPQDVVGLTVYLSSSESDWTSGGLFVVDGGFLA